MAVLYKHHMNICAAFSLFVYSHPVIRAVLSQRWRKSPSDCRAGLNPRWPLTPSGYANAESILHYEVDSQLFSCYVVIKYDSFKVVGLFFFYFFIFN